MSRHCESLRMRVIFITPGGEAPLPSLLSLLSSFSLIFTDDFFSSSFQGFFRFSCFPPDSTGVRTRFSDLRGYSAIRGNIGFGCSAISRMGGVLEAFSGGWMMLRPLYHYYV